MQLATTGIRAEIGVVFIRCRKCGAERRTRTPFIAELRCRADREIRCTNDACRALLGLWSSSTGTD